MLRRRQPDVVKAATRRGRGYNPVCRRGYNPVCSTGCNPVPHRRALFPVLDLFNHRSGAQSKLARRGEVWELISRDEYAEGEQARPRTTYYLLPTTC